MSAGATNKTDCFFDTNIIVYLVSPDTSKATRSDELIEAGGTVSVQVLNEFATVARRKYKMDWATIRLILATVKANCGIVPITVDTHTRGLVYAERYQLSIYDGMILAAATLAGCATLYSEDMHDGLVVDGVTVRNPYSRVR